jgi:hypothetical protein
MLLTDRANYRNPKELYTHHAPGEVFTYHPKWVRNRLYPKNLVVSFTDELTATPA